MNDSRTLRETFEAQAIEAASRPDTVFEVGIPMRDGVELAADVYLPPDAELPVPAVIQSTPYDKSNELFFEHESRLPQANGYAAIVHDVRGRGKSGGEWRAFVHDGQDTHDVIEWAIAKRLTRREITKRPLRV